MPTKNIDKITVLKGLLSDLNSGDPTKVSTAKKARETYIKTGSLPDYLFKPTPAAPAVSISSDFVGPVKGSTMQNNPNFVGPVKPFVGAMLTPKKYTIDEKIGNIFKSLKQYIAESVEEEAYKNQKRPQLQTSLQVGKVYSPSELQNWGKNFLQSSDKFRELEKINEYDPYNNPTQAVENYSGFYNNVKQLQKAKTLIKDASQSVLLENDPKVYSKKLNQAITHIDNNKYLFDDISEADSVAKLTNVAVFKERDIDPLKYAEEFKAFSKLPLEQQKKSPFLQMSKLLGSSYGQYQYASSFYDEDGKTNFDNYVNNILKPGSAKPTNYGKATDSDRYDVSNVEAESLFHSNSPLNYAISESIKPQIELQKKLSVQLDANHAKAEELSKQADLVSKSVDTRSRASVNAGNAKIAVYNKELESLQSEQKKIYDQYKGIETEITGLEDVFGKHIKTAYTDGQKKKFEGSGSILNTVDKIANYIDMVASSSGKIVYNAELHKNMTGDKPSDFSKRLITTPYNIFQQVKRNYMGATRYVGTALGNDASKIELIAYKADASNDDLSWHTGQFDFEGNGVMSNQLRWVDAKGHNRIQLGHLLETGAYQGLHMYTTGLATKGLGLFLTPVLGGLAKGTSFVSKGKFLKDAVITPKSIMTASVKIGAQDINYGARALTFPAVYATTYGTTYMENIGKFKTQRELSNYSKTISSFEALTEMAMPDVFFFNNMNKSIGKALTKGELGTLKSLLKDVASGQSRKQIIKRFGATLKEAGMKTFQEAIVEEEANYIATAMYEQNKLEKEGDQNFRKQGEELGYEGFKNTGIDALLTMSLSMALGIPGDYRNVSKRVGYDFSKPENMDFHRFNIATNANQLRTMVANDATFTPEQKAKAFETILENEGLLKVAAQHVKKPNEKTLGNDEDNTFVYFKALSDKQKLELKISQNKASDEEIKKYETAEKALELIDKDNEDWQKLTPEKRQTKWFQWFKEGILDTTDFGLAKSPFLQMANLQAKRRNTKKLFDDNQIDQATFNKYQESFKAAEKEIVKTATDNINSNFENLSELNETQLRYLQEDILIHGGLMNDAQIEGYKDEETMYPNSNELFVNSKFKQRLSDRIVEFAKEGQRAAVKYVDKKGVSKEATLAVNESGQLIDVDTNEEFDKDNTIAEAKIQSPILGNNTKQEENDDFIERRLSKLNKHYANRLATERNEVLKKGVDQLKQLETATQAIHTLIKNDEEAVAALVAANRDDTVTEKEQADAMMADTTSITKAYMEAKENQSNPELVAAVEQLFSQEPDELLDEDQFESVRRFQRPPQQPPQITKNKWSDVFMIADYQERKKAIDDLVANSTDIDSDINDLNTYIAENPNMTLTAKMSIIGIIANLNSKRNNGLPKTPKTYDEPTLENSVGRRVAFNGIEGTLVKNGQIYEIHTDNDLIIEIPESSIIYDEEINKNEIQELNDKIEKKEKEFTDNKDSITRDIQKDYQDRKPADELQKFANELYEAKKAQALEPLKQKVQSLMEEAATQKEKSARLSNNDLQIVQTFKDYNVEMSADNSMVAIDGVEYNVITDEKGNVIGLQDENGQTITDEKMLVAVEVERNTNDIGRFIASPKETQLLYNEAISTLDGALLAKGIATVGFTDLVASAIDKLTDRRKGKPNAEERQALEEWAFNVMAKVEELQKDPDLANNEYLQNLSDTAELMLQELYNENRRNPTSRGTTKLAKKRVTKTKGKGKNKVTATTRVKKPKTPKGKKIQKRVKKTPVAVVIEEKPKVEYGDDFRPTSGFITISDEYDQDDQKITDPNTLPINKFLKSIAQGISDYKGKLISNSLLLKQLGIDEKEISNLLKEYWALSEEDRKVKMEEYFDQVSTILDGVFPSNAIKWLFEDGNISKANSEVYGLKNNKEKFEKVVMRSYVMLITRTDGSPLRVDKDGKVVAKNGVVVTRAIPKATKEGYFYNIQPYDEELIKEDVKKLYELQQRFLKEKDLEIEVEDLKGSNGFDKKEYAQVAPVGNVTIQEVTSPATNRVKGAPYDSNGKKVFTKQLSAQDARAIATMLSKTGLTPEETRAFNDYINKIVYLTDAEKKKLYGKSISEIESVIKDKHYNIHNASLKTGGMIIPMSATGGVITPGVPVSYEKFMSNKWYTVSYKHATDESGQNIAGNRKIYFKIKSQEEEGEVFTEPTNLGTPLEPQEAPSNPLDELEFSKENSPISISNIDEAKAYVWFKSSFLSEGIRFNYSFLDNPSAFATFTDAAITLFKGSDYTMLYHEAWHRFTQHFLTKEEKEKLYGALKSMISEEELNEKDYETLEESLAEAFRSLMLNQGKTLNFNLNGNTISINMEKPKEKEKSLANTLAKYWDFLTSFFKDKPVTDKNATAKALIRDYLLEASKTRTIRKADPTNSLFKSLNTSKTQGRNFKVKTGDVEEDVFLDYVALYELSDGIDALFVDYFNKLKKTSSNPNASFVLLANQKKSVVNRNAGIIYDKVKEYIKALSSAEKNAEKKKEYEAVIQNFDFFIKNASAVRSGFKNSFIESAEEKLEDIKGEKDKLEIADTYETKMSQQELASSEIINLVTMIPVTDSKGLPLHSLSWKLPYLSDFSRNWSILADNLTGLNYNEMYDKITQLSNTKYPEFKALLENLPSKDSPSNSLLSIDQLKTQFEVVFSMPKVPEMIAILSSTQDGSLLVKFTEAGTSATREVVEQWKGQVEDFKLDNVFKSFPTLGSLNTTDNMLDFLSSVGVNFTNKKDALATINKNPQSFSDATVRIYEHLEKLYSAGVFVENPIDAITREYKDLEIRLYGVTKDEDGKWTVDKGNGKILKFDIRTEALKAANGKISLKGEETSLKVLTNVEISSNENIADDMILRADSTKAWKFNQFNYLSKLTNTLNTSTYEQIIEQYPQFDVDKNPGIITSPWFNALFNVEINEETEGISVTRNKKSSLDLIKTGGLKSEAIDEMFGTVTADLTAPDKLTMDFYTFLNSGIEENVKFGDKSIATAMKLVGVPKIQIHDIPALKQRLYDQLIGEITNIKHLEGLQQEFSENSKQLKHLSQGDKFVFFKKILGNNQELKAALLDDEFSPSDEVIKAQVMKAFDEYFQNIALGEFKTKLMSAFPADIKEDSIMPKIQDKRSTDTNASYSLNEGILWYYMHSVSNRIDQFNILYGDPRNYSNGSDVFKRLSAYSATGKFPITADWKLNRMNAEGRSLESLYSGTNRQFTSKFNIVQFNNEAVNLSMKDLGKDLPPDLLEKWNEYVKESDGKDKGDKADASGAVTLDFYKAINSMIGTWDPKQEDAYKAQVEFTQAKIALARGDASDFERYEKAKEKAKATYDDLLTVFNPKKWQYAGSIFSTHTVASKMDMRAFLKFSIMPIIPSNVEGTELEKVLENMYKTNTDLYVFNSGSKMSMDQDNQNFYDWVKEDKTDLYNPTVLDLNNFKEQLPIENKMKEEGIFASQMRKLMSLGLFENGEVVKGRNAEEYNKFKQSVSNITEAIKLELESKLSNPKKLVQFLEKEFDKRDMPEHVKDFLNFYKQDNAIVNSLDLSMQSFFIQNTLFSIVNNKIINQRYSGGQFVQLPNIGYRKANFKENTKFRSGELRFYGVSANGNSTSMEIKIAFSKKYEGLLNIVYNNKRIGTVENLNKLLKDENFIKEHGKKFTLVGCRIPVDGFSTIESMRVAEFLDPIAGQVIIVPDGLTIKSGSDFDIDKLNIYEPHLDENGELVTSDFKSPFNIAIRITQEERIKAKLLSLYDKQKDLKSADATIELQNIDEEIAKLDEEDSQELDLSAFTSGNLEDLQDRFNKANLNPTSETKKTLEDKKKALLKTEDTARQEYFKNDNEIYELKMLLKDFRSSRKAYMLAEINNLIQSASNVILDNKNNKNLIGTNELKYIEAAYKGLGIPTKKESSLDISDVTDPITSNTVTKNNNSSKKSLGIAAKSNTLYAMFMEAGMAIVNPSLTSMSENRVGDTVSLSSMFTQPYKGNNKKYKDFTGPMSIPKLNAEFISATVDVANDNRVGDARFNFNKMLAPIYIYGVMRGTHLFDLTDITSTPFIQNFVNEYLKRDSIVYKNYIETQDYSDIEKKKLLSKSNLKSKALEDATPDAFKAMVPVEGKNGEFIKDKNGKVKLFFDYDLTIEKVIQNAEYLKGTDALNLAEFLTLMKDSNNLTELSSAVSWDTSTSKSLVEFEYPERKLAKIKEQGFFSAKAIDKIRKESIISSLNVSKFVSDTFSPLFSIVSSDIFKTNLLEMYEYTNRVDLEDFSRAYNNDFMTFLFQNNAMLNDQLARPQLLEELNFLDKNNPDNIEQLFRNALGKAKGSGIANNGFLKAIQFKKTRGSNDIKIRLKNANVDIRSLNVIHLELLKLLNSTYSVDQDVNDEIMDVTDLLVKTISLTNGINKTYASLNEILPTDYYTDTIRDVLTKGINQEDYDKFNELFFINRNEKFYSDLEIAQGQEELERDNKNNYFIYGEDSVSSQGMGAVATQNTPKGEMVKEGIYVNQEALSKEEQLELFNYLKPFLEEQAAKTNKSISASKMIGLGLRWDYKSNNPGKQAVNIPDVIDPKNFTKYGYYTTSINNQPLAPITDRFRELMQKATGVDMTNYDGAIINLYAAESTISTHNDVDESRSAINYPVIGINLGGTGNFSIESRDGSPKQLNLKAGTGYVFGVNGVNREVFHRTFRGAQDSFLPELTTKIDGKTYEPGSYRVTITMRRVMPLEEGMPSTPSIVNESAIEGQAPTQPSTSIKNRRAFEDEALHQAFVKGGLEAVSKLIKERNKKELDAAKQLSKEVDMLTEFEELHFKTNKTLSENDRIIELYTILKNSEQLNFEYSLNELGLSTQPSKIEEQTPAKFIGEMTYSYGNDKRSNVTANTTFDAILSGERTATTRYESQGKLDYWKSAKVGDIITWKSKDGKTVDVRVTKALHPLKGSGKTAEIWSKLEGWSVNYFNAKVRAKLDEAWEIEFELLNKPNVQTPTTPTEEQKTVTVSQYKYYGAIYNIVTENGVGVDVKDYKGKTANKEKLLQAFNNNPNVDPQNPTVVTPVVAPVQQVISQEKSFTFKNGITVSTPFELNDQQKEALNNMADFIENPQDSDNHMLLTGYAGTGKTATIAIFHKYLKKKYYTPVYTSPTHRANAVTKLNNPQAKVLTLHSLFGLSPDIELADDNSFTMKDLKFGAGNKQKIQGGDILIVDESSMIGDDLFEYLNDGKDEFNLKIIYVGDPGQLGPVSKNGKLSEVFAKIENVSALTKVERTGDNPILNESTNLRNGQPLTFKSESAKDGFVEYITSSRDKIAAMVENFSSEEYANNKLHFRVLAGTNKVTNEVNNDVREFLYPDSYQQQIVPGETLMGKANFKTDYVTGQSLIMNSGDYETISVTPGTKTKTGITLTGFKTLMQNSLDKSQPSFEVFIVDNKEFENPENPTERFADLVSDILVNAIKAKKKGNTVTAAQLFAAANELQSEFLFMKPIMKRNTYGEDKLVIKQSLDYGYALTVHKSQGGTYDKVLIMLDSIRNARFSPSTKQQLEYVAMSRASKGVYVSMTADTALNNKPLVQQVIDQNEASEMEFHNQVYNSLDKPTKRRLTRAQVKAYLDTIPFKQSVEDAAEQIKCNL